MHHVVVWDPDGRYWEGAIVEAVLVNELRDRGVATLPCIPRIFEFAGVSGYSKRSWGWGWPLESFSKLSCPLTMFHPADAPTGISWAARLMPSEPALARVAAGHAPSEGVLQLASGELRGNLLPGTVAGLEGKNSVDLTKLRKPDARGGWTIYGDARLSVRGEGCFSLGLYGHGAGMRVAWVAATLTP